MSKFIKSIFLLLMCTVMLNGLQAQNKDYNSESASIKVSRTEIQDDSIHQIRLPYVLELSTIEQFMQSVRLIFTLSNNTTEQLNNFWLHISLLDKNKGFLYREQPALFSEVRPDGKQQIEMLCESVGLEEVGYIVLHPQLLETARVEQYFDTKIVKLVLPPHADVKMVFNNNVR